MRGFWTRIVAYFLLSRGKRIRMCWITTNLSRRAGQVFLGHCTTQSSSSNTTYDSPPRVASGCTRLKDVAATQTTFVATNMYIKRFSALTPHQTQKTCPHPQLPTLPPQTKTELRAMHLLHDVTFPDKMIDAIKFSNGTFS